MQILLDESGDFCYAGDDWNLDYSEDEMNLFDVMNKDFTVTFTKTDGTLREMTGNFFGPDKGVNLAEDQMVTKLVDHMFAPMDTAIPVYTSAGWRSFIKGQMIKLEIV